MKYFKFLIAICFLGLFFPVEEMMISAKAGRELQE